MNFESCRYLILLRFLQIAGVLLAIAPAATCAAMTDAGHQASSSEQPTVTSRDDRANVNTDGEAEEAQKIDDEEESGEAEEDAPPAEVKRPLTEQELLIREAKALLEELHRLRHELAEAQLARAEMQRELDEMRRFIADHHEYGRDFEEYQRIREIKQREQEQLERREARERYERERQKRMERQESARELRVERRVAERREREFRQHGFEPIGMDIFVGRMAYQYRIRDTLRTRITYDPFFGFFTQRDYRDRIDFTEMTLSGAVINASDEVRNLGIAITFFDGSGNQVGHEIVQVNYARPGVPYPFTSTVSMALNRPFATSSSYVLYADRADLE